MRDPHACPHHVRRIGAVMRRTRGRPDSASARAVRLKASRVRALREADLVLGARCWVLGAGDTHGFQDDALGPLAIPLPIENTLPRAEVELAFGHRHDHLVPNRE